jgi:hypothetical protein
MMIIVVLDENGEEITITGRAAAIVRWSIDHAKRLNSSLPLKLEFNCAGSEIKPRILEDSPPMRV